jgi:hypothetical protein
MDRRPDMDGEQVVANYYNCQSMQHTEFTCLSYYYHNRRFTRDKWCKVCADRYPERIGYGDR